MPEVAGQKSLPATWKANDRRALRGMSCHREQYLAKPVEHATEGLLPDDEHEPCAQHVEESSIEVQEEVLQMHARVHLALQGCLVVDRGQAGNRHAAKCEGHCRWGHKAVARVPANAW